MDESIRRFRNLLDVELPHDAVVEAFGVESGLSPVAWAVWGGKRHRHAAANDPEIRLAEPNLPDVRGEKYYVAGGGPPSRSATLIGALRTMIDRQNRRDSVRVTGSGRPIVVWRERKGVRGLAAPEIEWVGASMPEAKALDRSGLLVELDHDTVLLRIRMRRSTLRRIRKASEFERQKWNDGRKGKYMSACTLAAILAWLESVEAEMAVIEAAHFSGSTP